MGKKKQQQVETVQAEPVDDENENEDDEDYLDEEDDEEEEMELLQVDLGDMVKLKQVLDEAVAGVILEKVEEDYRWDNIKLTIMSIACLFAVVAQFAPIPFPESRPLLGVCGCAYFALSGVLQLIATFVDKDSILLTKPFSTGRIAPPAEEATAGANKKSKNKKDLKETQKKKNEMLEKYGVRVRSNLPRFSEWYSVILEYQMDDDKEQQQQKEKDPSPFVEQRWSVGQFFDKEGYFDEVGLMQEVESLFTRLEQEKYDTPEDVKKMEKKNQ